MESIADIRTFLLNEAKYWSRCEAFRKYSYGNRNEHKKYRVLCNKERMAGAQGLLSTVAIILPDIIEARVHGYIPVIDLCRNSRCQPLLQEKNLAKKENAWEYYFTQPDREVSLEEVRQSQYVEEQIKNCGHNQNYYMGDSCLKSKIQTRILSRAVCQNVHLQPDINRRVIREKRRLFSQTDKILGVGIRAGYRFGIMNNLDIFNGHPIVGSCADYIRDIEKKLSEWNYNSFFLAIDDREYLEQIKKYFGNSCIHLERPRIHYFQDALKDTLCAYDDQALRMFEFEGLSVRNRNEDYLVELYLLAQCDGLYASRGTGHNFAYLLNNGKYSHVEFIDLKEFQYKG